MCKRCAWAKTEPDLTYHDTEWGKPVYDDQQLFEKLLLDGMQAGLSWTIILKKRDHIKKAFYNFDPEKCAKMSDKKIEELLANPNIIRSNSKIRAVKKNAAAYLKMREELGSFSDFLWQFVGGEPIVNNFKTAEDMPTQTERSAAMSKELKKRGFSFVGPVICYAFMEAVGMVNDHLVDCAFRF